MLEHYGGTPSSEEGLVILVRNYNKLGMYDLAFDSARVLNQNYPQYRIIKDTNDISVIKDEKIENEIINTTDLQQEEGSWLDKLNPFNWF